MIEKVASKEANIAIVSDAIPLRSTLRQALTEIGFHNIIECDTHKSLNQALDSKNIHWIISSLFFEGQKKNALQILEKIIDDPATKGIAFSLVLNKKETSAIPLAFEAGCLSWHPIFHDTKPLRQNFSEFLGIIAEENQNPIKVAASYLRKHLMKSAAYASLNYLEEALIDFFPGEPELLLNFARSQLKINNLKAAKKLKDQALFLDPKLGEKIQDLQASIDDTSDATNRHFGVRRCVVIDPDEAMTFYVKGLLEELGIEQVEIFVDGESAWNWLRFNEEPELIIMEWRLAKLSGLALVQRIRERGFYNASIVVMSSLVNKNDEPLLNEMSISNLLVKPFGKEDFYLAIRDTLKQDETPTEQKSLERNIKLALKRGDVNEAKQLKAAYMANRKIAPHRKLLIEAQFLYHSGKYEQAKAKVAEAINTSNREPLDAISLLGKCFLRLGDETAALNCFERAQSISPNNLERLCDMADLQIRTGQVESAKRSVDHAQDIDAKSDQVIASGVKLAFAKNNLDEAKKLFGEISSQSELVAIMNNHAIALTLSEQIDKATQIYQRLYLTIPESEPELKSIVAYNQGLAYARTNDLNLAKRCLEHSLHYGAKNVKEKARSLNIRIKKALKDNGKLILNLAHKESDELDDIGFEEIGGETFIEKDFVEIFTTSAKPGEMALYLIFHFQDEYSPLCKRIIKTLTSRHQIASHAA